MPITKTNNKKDGLQQYRVRINYVDQFGKPHNRAKLVYGLAEAKQAEQNLLEEVGKEKPATARMTVQQLYDEYILAKENEVRYSSLVKIKNCISKGVLPMLSDKQIAKLTVKHMQEWKNETAKIGFAQATLRNYYGEFRQMLNYAVKMGYIPKNPLTIVGNFKESFEIKSKDKIQYYTAEQFIAFIAEAKKAAQEKDTINEWSYYVFFNIAFYTGARKGEIYALKWSDIEGNILHIRRSVAQKYGTGNIETPPKNKSSYRDLQIPTPLMEILLEQKERQMQDEKFTEDFRICGGIDCIRDSTVTNKNVEYANKAGLPHIRVHDFRHTHATLLVNEGINIQEIARRLGHSNVEITWNTYSHLYPREEERAISVLDKVFLK